MRYASVLLVLTAMIMSSCDNNLINGDPPTIPVVYPSIDGYPAWSPDGTKIIYNHYGITRISPGGMFSINPDSSGLWMMNADGSDQRLILRGFDIYPAWSADGQWIAFERGGQIYKVSVKGDSLDKSRIQQLTFQGGNFFPTWSPDGEWIAYDSDLNDPKGANVIWKMKADGTNKRDISEHGIGEWRMPDWSPDERYIVHQRYVGVNAPEIVVMDTSGANPLRLTYDDRDDFHPKYSPYPADGGAGGTKIVFQSNTQVVVMNSDGSNPRQLTTTGGRSPSWSPDGMKIVYIGFADPEQYNPRGNATVWVMNADGTRKRQLTFGPSPSSGKEVTTNE